MKRTVWVPALLCLLVPLGLEAAENGGDATKDAIREVLETAYVRGVFIDRDESLVRGGFHPEFVMPLVDGDRLIVAPLDMWLERLGLDGEAGSASVEPRFERIDVTGNTATVKIELWIDGVHTYTDYFALYELDGDWKIVTKVFAVHGS